MDGRRQAPNLRIRSRSRLRRRLRRSPRRQRRARRGFASPASGIAEAGGADRDDAAPRPRAGRARASPLSTPPMPTTGIDTAAATSATCLSAIVRTAGPESPPLPAPSQGSPPGASGAALSVLISETASAPALLRRDRDRSRVGDVRRQLHDQRLAGQRPQRLQQRRRLARLLADDQARVHVRAGDVELDRSDLVALARPPRPARRTPRRSSPSPRRSAAPAARPAAAGRRPRKPSSALVGQPDRVDHRRRLLPEPRRRVADPRLGGDRLRDVGAERELARARRRRTPGARRSRRTSRRR